MPASVACNCRFCSKRKKCPDVPKNELKEMKGASWCYVSQKSAELAEKATYRGKKVGKRKNLTAEEEKENENG